LYAYHLHLTLISEILLMYVKAFYFYNGGKKNMPTNSLSNRFILKLCLPKSIKIKNTTI